MEPSDWIEAAGDYQQEVSSAFDRDREGLIRSLIERHGSGEKSSIDRMGQGSSSRLKVEAA